MSVNVELCGCERAGRRTLGVQVRNDSSDPIGPLSVRFNWENEQHQPNPDGSRTAAGGTVLTSPTPFRGTLQPGEGRLFCLGERYQAEEVLGRVESLSPERYWIAVFQGEREIARVDGRLIGGVLAGLGL